MLSHQSQIGNAYNLIDTPEIIWISGGTKGIHLSCAFSKSTLDSPFSLVLDFAATERTT